MLKRAVLIGLAATFVAAMQPPAASAQPRWERERHGEYRHDRGRDHDRWRHGHDGYRPGYYRPPPPVYYAPPPRQYYQPPGVYIPFR